MTALVFAVLAVTITGPVEWLLVLGGVVGAVTGIVGVMNRWLVQPLIHNLDESIAEKLAPIRDDIKEIRYEVRFDGGESLKDRVRDISVDIARLSGQVEAITAIVSKQSPTPQPQQLPHQEGDSHVRRDLPA